MISARLLFAALLCICALIPAASAASSSSKGFDCEDPQFLQTWHDEFCCPQGGFMFEWSPPGRAVAGPRCTKCPMGTHYPCEDGNCCAAGTFCIRVNDQPLCSTTNVPSQFDSAPFAAPTGVLTPRTHSDESLDRHPNPRKVPPSSTMVLIVVFSCIGGVIFLVLLVLFCVWYHSSQRRQARERARDKATLERLEASVEAQSAKAARAPVVVVVSSRTTTSNNGESAALSSSSELAPLSRGRLARGSSQSQLEEVAPEDAKLHFYPQISNV